MSSAPTTRDPRGHAAPAPPAGRRERNKARTRERLLEALRSQLTEDGLELMTVEAVAEAAGVSRRTFFNYFPSLEAAVAEGMSVPIAGMTQAFVARPPDEAPLVAMERALEAAPVPRELLHWIAAVRCSGLERHAVAVNIWAYHQEWLERLLRERLKHADELAVTSLAGAVMAIFEAAERRWLQTTGETVDDEAAAEFNRLLRRGLQLAARGWTTEVPGTTTG
ncbi:TetR/AcrR family transcriptional regulator [Ornithinimicrobium cavernae]|uniref:TetR/AcrR family transcriptional regulator n=1 Tax=Ornithinimicrobium cavernae TaxID=2666047 RepID=UPI00137B8F42|nr:TetR/AcrR family transcriptional regulator [Ornithinimicrobium cavernae]